MRADYQSMSLDELLRLYDEATLSYYGDGEAIMSDEIHFEKSPGIFFDGKRLFPILDQRDKCPALLFQRQKDLFFLLTAYKKFLQCMLIQFPFTHIIIKCLDSLILILEDFIKIPGSEQLDCFSRIPV